MPNRKANNDIHIYRILFDDNYRIDRDGTLWTRISVNGKGLLPQNRYRKAGTIDSHGYNIFKPRIDGKQVKIAVHRLVYAMFNGKLDSSKVIDHINRNKLDNKPENLRLVTVKDNNRNK